MAPLHPGPHHLCRHDRVLRAIIKKVGPFTLRPKRDRFGMLVRSIISQQISVRAARSIQQRLVLLAGSVPIRPDRLLELGTEQLRTSGISPQKARYLLDLAQMTNRGQVNLRTIGRRSDEQVIAELIQVKGIGRWTAQMFLIFALGRLDILPHDDLGIRSAMRNLYGLPDLPDRQTIDQIAEPWRPYASVASWYCWRSLEIPREKAKS